MPEQRNPKPKARAKPVIMVVDDEPVIRETLLEILAEVGYDALGMSNSIQVLRWIDNICPDVMLIDVIMPGLNGIDLAIKVRSILPECRIVLISGNAETGTLLEQALAQGNKFEILAKPINPDVLLSVLRLTSKHAVGND